MIALFASIVGLLCGFMLGMLAAPAIYYRILGCPEAVLDAVQESIEQDVEESIGDSIKDLHKEL